MMEWCYVVIVLSAIALLKWKSVKERKSFRERKRRCPGCNGHTEATVLGGIGRGWRNECRDCSIIWKLSNDYQVVPFDNSIVIIEEDE